MTSKDLANVMYPNVDKTIYDYEKMYPNRKNNGVVTRFAPSPTGYVHMGSLFTAFVAWKVSLDTDGIFYLRIEDTDGKRSVVEGVNKIIDDLSKFDIIPLEGVMKDNVEVGDYGPYIQSKRIDIYNTFAKYLVENDYAYPCFCSSEMLSNIRKKQEDNKERIGYYGKYARCRNLSKEEAIKRICNGDKYVLRLKSSGNIDKKFIFNDLVKGKVSVCENDIDHVLVKSDGVPVYHFAHVIDDHLMRTTHVIRGEEWLSSINIHLELFNMFHFDIPKYAHLGLVMKIDDNGVKRKLSKRLDPESAISFYYQKGIPIMAVKLYLLTIANSNFEQWYMQNPDKDISLFKLDFKKISDSGTLFDIKKLENISKNYLASLSASEVYEGLVKYTKEFDYPFYEVLCKYEDYSVLVLNIERERKNARKDYSSYSEVFKCVSYMYDEFFDFSYGKRDNLGNVNYDLLDDYIKNYYDITSYDVWYKNILDVSIKYNYAVSVKEYKLNPDIYNGHIGDVCGMIRFVVTNLFNTPSLYEIMKVIGYDRLLKRFEVFLGKRIK